MSNLKSAPKICSISLEKVTFGEVTVPTVSEGDLLVLSGDVGASAARLASVGGRHLASLSPLVGGLSAEDDLSVLVTDVLAMGGGSEEGGTSIVVGVASVEKVGGAASAGSLEAGCERQNSHTHNTHRIKSYVTCLLCSLTACLSGVAMVTVNVCI